MNLKRSERSGVNINNIVSIVSIAFQHGALHFYIIYF